jgi:tetratricopeptide (TPR) repeat protein
MMQTMDDEPPQSEIAGLSDADALHKIGLLIDSSFDVQSASGTDQAFALLDEFESRCLSPDLIALAHYFRANAWANREQMQTNPNVWSWEQPECQEQILALRRTVCHDGFQKLPAVRRCQVLTNLANQLDKIGRFIEAIEIFDRALSLNGKFGMARGNRGIALSHYARALYDGGHTAFMLVPAHEALMSALGDDAFYESADYTAARVGFLEEARKIESRMDVGAVRQKIAGREYELGESTAERQYRGWCLKNRLFINPLNDVGALPIAAQDVLTLPSLTVDATSRSMPPVIGFFNQIKQEFVSARYLYYEGLRAKGAALFRSQCPALQHA